MTNISSASGNPFNKTFQTSILAHMFKDREVFDSASKNMMMSDLDLPYLQVLWESLVDFVATYGELPGQEMFYLHTLKVTDNKDGKYMSYVSPEETPALAEAFSFIVGYSQLNSAYIQAELPKYINWVRSSRAIDMHIESIEAGRSSEALMRDLTKIEDQTSAFAREDAPSIFDCLEDDDDDFLVTEENYVERLGLGIPRIDAFMDGGLVPGEIGVLNAPTGVGKTNMLINILLNANMLGYHGAFFSLEVQKDTIKRRYIAMAYNLSIDLFKVPIERWGEKQKQQYQLAKAYAREVRSRSHIMSTEGAYMNTDELEKEVDKWKMQQKKKFGNTDHCKLAIFDWINFITLPSRISTSEEWKVPIRVSEQLRAIGALHGLVVWVANQVKPTCAKNPTIGPNDIFGGGHILNAADLAVGFNLTRETRQMEENLEASTGGSTKRLQEKDMVATIMKARNSSIGALTMYQAPTLRFFDNKQSFTKQSRQFDAALGLGGTNVQT